MSDEPSRTPPVGEEIHMPAASVLPLLTALALTLLLLASTRGVYLWAPALVLLLSIVGRWVASAASEHRALSADHH